MMPYLTILILETVLNATPRHRPQSLINYGEPLQRGSIRRGEQAQIAMATEVAVQVHDIHYEMKQNTGTKFLHNFRFYTRLSLYVFEISCVFIRY